jgi:hypothetical protein
MIQHPYKNEAVELCRSRGLDPYAMVPAPIKAGAQAMTLMRQDIEQWEVAHDEIVAHLEVHAVMRRFGLLP